MKKIHVGLILFSCLLIVGAIFTFYNKSSLAKNSNEIQRNVENERKIKEAEEVMKKIDEKEFSQQVTEALEKNGYNPGVIAYQIYSSKKQIIVITLEDIDPKDKEIKKDINKIVNTISKDNDLNPFIINLQEKQYKKLPS